MLLPPFWLSCAPVGRVRQCPLFPREDADNTTNCTNTININRNNTDSNNDNYKNTTDCM